MSTLHCLNHQPVRIELFVVLDKEGVHSPTVEIEKGHANEPFFYWKRNNQIHVQDDENEKSLFNRTDVTAA